MAGTTPMISPGVRVNIVDESQYTALSGLPSNAFGIVGGAKFGPINVPTLLTSVNQFIQIFSTPVDIAGLTAINTLSAGGTIYYCRFATADAAAMQATITGTGGNLILKATQKGTLLEGTWKAVVTAGSSSSTFNLEVTRIVGTNDPIVVIEKTELSLDSNADNYYTSWNNDFFTLSAEDDNEITTIAASEIEISSGNDGIKDSRSDNATAVCAALETLSDRETYELMYLTSPDYSIDSTVATQMVSIATTRKDCIVQIDHDPNPSAEAYLDGNKFSLTKFITVLKKYATTPYVGLWAGLGGYVINAYQNNAEVLAPVSAYLIPALAAEYSVNPVWTAPASSAYLNLTNLSRLDKIWSQSDRDELYTNNINPITNYKGMGYTAMGQKSGQTSKSAMDRLNVVQLVNYVKVGIEKISVDFLFAPIDDETFGSWIGRVTNFLNNIRNRRGLYDFKVKMDWETVTSDAINNNMMPGIVQIKPTKVAEFIDVDLVIKNYSDQME